MSAELTPNVVVSNPQVRRVANIVIGGALIVFPTAVILEANSELDFSAWLPAATAVTSFLAGVFGIAVTAPNIPTVRKDAKIAATAEAIGDDVIDETTSEDDDPEIDDEVFYGDEPLALPEPDESRGRHAE